MVSRAVVALAVVALAACGASDEPPPPRPTLPVNVAEQLAAQSDRVTAALRAGDGCRAQVAAERLRQETIAAVNERRVPTAFQEQLLGAVNDLAGRIVCIPVDEDEEENEGKGHGNGKGNGKRKDKGKD
jgi:hypothetical protein